MLHEKIAVISVTVFCLLACFQLWSTHKLLVFQFHLASSNNSKNGGLSLASQLLVCIIGEGTHSG